MKVVSQLLLAVLFVGVYACSDPASNSMIELSWISPTTNTDGTLLEDLAGYELRVSSLSYEYVQTINVPLGSQELNCRPFASGDKRWIGKTKCSYLIRGLREGRYAVIMKAYNVAGIKSDYSNEVMKTAVLHDAGK